MIYIKKKGKANFFRINSLPLAVTVLGLLFVVSCGNADKSVIPVGKVKKGTFYLDVFEEGEIKATNFESMVAPNVSWRYGMLKITRLIEDGTEVNAGDTLIVFDPSEVQKSIVESEADLEIRLAEREKLIAQQKSSIEGLKEDLEIAKISQEISRIQFESADYEAEIKKKEIELNLEKANIALERAREQIKNKQKIQEEELKQKQLDITRARNDLEEANETVNKLSVVSPSPGIAIINRNHSTDNKYQVGDQTWRGTDIIELPDLNELKAVVQINEVDISKITNGLRVEIKPDAFSDSIYTGSVIEVANLAIDKDRDSRIKVFPVDILIETPSKNLLPGLTVSCRIIVDEIEDVLSVPQEAVHSEVNGDFVFVKTASGFVRREVELGQANTDFVIILKGLKEEDEVALSDPFEEEEAGKEQ